MARKSTKDNSTPISAITHADKRANIPTEELRDFVAEEEQRPGTMRYPRDPSLDPQLVWQGKDEQDGEDLAVPVVPVYIQEKIKPQAIIEDLRAQVEAPGQAPDQLAMFADFNGIEFSDLVEFYEHEQNWTNRLILGDSLLVMTSLAEKEGLKGKVQMIYVDPPYGIKFGSNWQVSTRKRDVKDGKAEDVTRQPEQVRAFRDTWEKGIHSYLAYLRDRFVVARDLLTETGSIFVQIGDENVHLVRCLLDEVFGSENFCAIITVAKTSGASSPMARTNIIAGVCDYLIWYAKDADRVKYRGLYREKAAGDEGSGNYRYVQLADGLRRSLTRAEMETPSAIPAGASIYRLSGTSSQTRTAAPPAPFGFRGARFRPEGNRGWSTTDSGLEHLALADRLVGSGNTLTYVRFHNDFPVSPLPNFWSDTNVSGFGDTKVYVVQTLTRIVERCLLLSTDPGDLVLDPTCGSGTTAYVAEQWGRRWITMDTSRVALALARTRLMSARFPYYKLADPAGADIKRGFEYKTVPHITLKSIANNEEIDEIHARWQEKLEPLRAEINTLAGEQWEEWEVPRPGGADTPVCPDQKPAGKSACATDLQGLLTRWWDLRRQRQAEIDASIARRADTEVLYDQPTEDRKRIRVTGPFTVESLSPHRVLSTDEELPASEQEGHATTGPGQFETMILENLKTAGVQNTVKQERLKFDFLDPYAGLYLHATGEYTEADGTSRRVAVCIGPEHGTVGPQLVKEAAKEAVQGVGFDTLIVCGFAFDPHVDLEKTRYGKLVVLPTRMNPDLSMGKDLLKKTGAGNLFMIFGEPDLEVQREGGQIEVSLRGVDVYDPTTGEIRSHTTEDIACWFVDTNYNGESFFVRQAYFTGGDAPYDKLKRALRAEIDEAAWSSLYRTTSRPFPVPETGKIAVKVINHYGDEVLKVYEVQD
jgi:adenine-specific DNA-methyltransferase